LEAPADDVHRRKFQIDRLADQTVRIGKAADGPVEPRKLRSRRMIGDRGAISAAIKVRQAILAGRGECCSLVGQQFAIDVAERNEIGCIGRGNRDKLPLALG